jgi:hypothetical protein
MRDTLGSISSTRKKRKKKPELRSSGEENKVLRTMFGFQ